MAAVFIAQATNSHMDIFHQITLLVVLLLSSKGAAGVTGSGFIAMKPLPVTPAAPFEESNSTTSRVI